MAVIGGCGCGGRGTGDLAFDPCEWWLNYHRLIYSLGQKVKVMAGAGITRWKSVEFHLVWS